MKTVNTLLLLPMLLLGLLSATPVTAETNDILRRDVDRPLAITAVPESDVVASEQDIRKLIEVNGGAEAFRGLLTQYSDQLQKLRPDVPAEFWKGILSSTNLAELINLAIPIYQKHFTHREVSEIISFMQSAIGKKMAKELPEITKELAIAGQAWGERIGTRLAAQAETNEPVNKVKAKPITYPTDKPAFRIPSVEEVKQYESQGISGIRPDTPYLIYPREMTDPDKSPLQRATERNIIGSWRTWAETTFGYTENTLTLLPGGKVNYLVTEVTYPIDVLKTKPVYSGEPSYVPLVYSGTWKLVDGHISYELVNGVSTAEKVLSVTENRLTCISGTTGHKYVMYRVSPQ